MSTSSRDSGDTDVSELEQDSGPTRWVDQDDPTDTGVPVDIDYCQAHEPERTVPVGYNPGEEACTSGGQPLSTDPRDGSGSNADAFIDENGESHTVAGESSSIVGSTFYGDDADDVRKFDRLFLFHSGKDSHKRGSGDNVNPRHKENEKARFNHERAEILCDHADLTPRQKHATLEAVDATDFRRFTYLCQKADDGVGAVEVVTVGIIACVVAFWTDEPLEHPAVAGAAQVVGVNDVAYVSREVADKKAFPWVTDGTFAEA